MWRWIARALGFLGCALTLPVMVLSVYFRADSWDEVRMASQGDVVIGLIFAGCVGLVTVPEARQNPTRTWALWLVAVVLTWAMVSGALVGWQYRKAEIRTNRGR
jgi:hypothetical protein